MMHAASWKRSLRRSFQASKRGFWDDVPVWHRLLEERGPIRLTEDQRHALREILTLIHLGEQTAVTVTGQLVALVGDHEAKQVLAAQTFEEAKHVEVLARYLKEIEGHTTDPNFAPKPNRWGAWVLRDIERTKKPILKLLGMQLLVENLAHHLFRELRTALNEPVLCGLLEYLEADEAKHVGLARNYLPHLLQQCSELEGLYFLGKLGTWSLALVESARQLRTSAECLGVDLLGATIRCARDHRRLVAALGRPSWTLAAETLMSEDMVERVAGAIYGRTRGRLDVRVSA